MVAEQVGRRKVILYVHIGSHKTGTTAIQRFANSNSRWLSEQGLTYPNLDLVNLDRRRSHLAVFSGLCDLPGFDYGISRHDALKFLSAAARHAGVEGRPLLLSAENIFRMSEHEKDLTFAVLAGIFSGFDIRIVAGLRRQDRFFESMYRNDFKSDRAPSNVQSAFSKRQEMLDYEAMLQCVYKWFPTGGHILLPYSQDTRRSFVRDFFAALGISVPADMMPGPTANVSYDVVDCLALQELFRRNASSEERAKFREFIEKRRIATDHRFVNAEMRSELRKKYSDGNERLVAKYPLLSAELSWPGDLDSGVEAATRHETLAADVAQRLHEFAQGSG